MNFDSDFASKYGLVKDEDYWWHKQSSHWIVKHDAMVRIADMEGIKFSGYTPIDAGPQHKAILVTASKDGLGSATQTGECRVEPIGRNTIPVHYPWAIAQKRAEDRAALRLIAPGGEIYTDADSHEFAKDYQPPQERAPAATPRHGASTPNKVTLARSYGELLPSEDFRMYYASALLMDPTFDTSATIPFGKHKGATYVSLASEPKGYDYLEWLISSTAEKSPDVGMWKDGAINALKAIAYVVGKDNPAASNPEPDNDEPPF